MKHFFLRSLSGREFTCIARFGDRCLKVRPPAVELLGETILCKGGIPCRVNRFKESLYSRAVAFEHLELRQRQRKLRRRQIEEQWNYSTIRDPLRHCPSLEQ